MNPPVGCPTFWVHFIRPDSDALFSDVAAQDIGDLSRLVDQLLEFFWLQTLSAVAQCAFRIVMHLDDQPVSSGGDRC